MANVPSRNLQRVLTVVAGILIVKVTVEVMVGYVNYFPANFGSDFLRGRELYFFGPYQWAFYPHIASGPLADLCRIGTIERTTSTTVSEVAPDSRTVSLHQCSVCGESERPVDGLSRVDWHHRRHRVRGPRNLDGNHLRARLANCDEASICRSSALDVAKLFAVVLGRRAAVARRIGDAAGSSIRLV